jgi:polysaccharide pyruvyl transferase WcaK-like protein
MLVYLFGEYEFLVGGDDRDFYYRFVDEQAFEKDSYDIDNRLTGIDVVAEAIANSELCLCMRFHSTVFADTLCADYLSIDYTNGGKVKGFLDDAGKSERLVTLAELQSGGDTIAEKVRKAYGA